MANWSWHKEPASWDVRELVPRGPTTRSSRLKNLATWLFAFLGIFALQELLWSSARTPVWAGGEAWTWLGAIWCLPLPMALFMLGGFLTYKRPETPIGVIEHPVAWRFVSRGENAEVLRSAIRSVHRVMRELPLFPYVIEVVTDSAQVDLSDLDVLHYVVPPDYQTPNKTLYKARALHYAITHSRIPEETWIMHCDEESHATPSLVSGIAQAVLEEERTGKHRIGQGVVLYHNEREDHPFMMMADMIRTGDDISRFSFQTRLFGVAAFGFHGSFILVRNSVAKEVGYDFGPKGSVTEDAFWALKQMDNGRRCRFVDGYMVEQAPQSVSDFMKQRRRWFLGLFETVRYAPTRLRFRLPLGLCIVIWSISWLTVFYTLMNLLIGYKTPLPIRVGGNIVFASFVSTYLIGQRLNLENNYPGFWQSAGWMLCQLVTVPLYSLWESMGVIYGFLKPELGFHVIAKNPRPEAGPYRPRTGLLPQPSLVVAGTAGILPREDWARVMARRLREELTHLEGGVVAGLDGRNAPPQAPSAPALGD